MLEKLHIYACAVAALAVMIAGIAMDMTLAEIGVRMIIAVPVFFVLGLAVRAYLTRKVFAAKPEEGLPEGGFADEKKTAAESEAAAVSARGEETS
ncbi:MAG: hypothetical protein FWC55_00600 [Firmicutes bacterium]|nr:hypothetical protein [Bacillota bacterium]